MHRRRFIAFLGGGTALPFAVRAQQKAMPVIGFLGADSPGPAASYLAAFHQGLSETGYVEGQNVAIEYRCAENHYDRPPALAADLVGQGVDVIVTSGTPPALAAKTATSTIPIVFNAGDPVESSLVASLARPGGNLTGVSGAFLAGGSTALIAVLQGDTFAVGVHTFRWLPSGIPAAGGR